MCIQWYIDRHLPWYSQSESCYLEGSWCKANGRETVCTFQWHTPYRALCLCPCILRCTSTSSNSNETKRFALPPPLNLWSLFEFPKASPPKTPFQHHKEIFMTHFKIHNTYHGGLILIIKVHRKPYRVTKGGELNALLKSFPQQLWLVSSQCSPTLWWKCKLTRAYAQQTQHQLS